MRFEDHRQRRRNRELPLAEFPSWGLEFMMGLYGPETIKRVCAEEHASGVVRRPLAAAQAGPSAMAHAQERQSGAGQHIESGPIIVEIEAMNALVRFLARRFRR